MLPHALCSHIQNAFRARHALISVEHNTQNLGILSILLRSGFITSITRGTTTGPNPASFLSDEEKNQRIWATLKYRDDLPVLHSMELVSKPSKKVFMTPSELRRLCSGRRAGPVSPLGMGEIAVVRTANKEFMWIEAREAVSMKMGGEVVCRAR
ncbi:mitochondrial ribosomal protein subunit S8 [Rhodocollybia butyracea]|uniref:Mitochondrial ribosomal protein subunit S8 n=1 Tax=Rhodocollybia butyracea TaxID=206335 RepID=A0A9P5PRT0_9AGAR|nr:mitochondrial ribosomal protein subunit S8 [Rhodocollybia butyracea]